jgi:hypothetical protein
MFNDINNIFKLLPIWWSACITYIIFAVPFVILFTWLEQNGYSNFNSNAQSHNNIPNGSSNSEYPTSSTFDNTYSSTSSSYESSNRNDIYYNPSYNNVGGNIYNHHQ